MELITNSSGERIDYSFHPASRSDCLVIIGHGLTGNKDRPLLIALAEGLAKNGWPSLRISFSGNGESEGAFTNSNITKGLGDLSSVIEQMSEGRLVAYIGHSMGGAIGILAAAQNKEIKTVISLAGMVHTAGFLKREFGELTPGESFMWDEPDHPLSQSYVDDLSQIGDTLDVAGSIQQPCFLIHGKEDDVILPTDSRDLLDVLNKQSKLIEIEKADHSFEGCHSELTSKISDWLKLYLKA